MNSPKDPENLKVVMDYANSIISGQKLACRDLIQVCQRFIRDLENPAYEFKTKDPEFVIHIIEKTFVHDQGERIDGIPLQGTPFLLEPWQKFIIYNLVGFYRKGTKIRRFNEAFIFVPRKNCSVACMQSHRKDNGTVYDLDLTDPSNESRNHIVGLGNNVYKPIFCRHCDEADCVAACMSSALIKDEETGLVLYDEEKCASCFMCVMNCAYGTIKPDT